MIDLDARLKALDEKLSLLRVSGGVQAAIGRWRGDAAALRFHLSKSRRHPLIVAILGGTGTGKSTLVNRLLDANLSAASFRRTFTSGPVAIAAGRDAVPAGWLGVEQIIATPEQMPARGQAGALIIIPVENELTRHLTLIDTPDLDGDQPAHHAQADRVFRWAEGIVFLVTPEKYQMNELLPYYRLAARYHLPTIFVMNKCEDMGSAEDYRRQLEEGARGKGQGASGDAAAFSSSRPLPLAAGPFLFILARDDAAYEPPPDAGLAGLRSSLMEMTLPGDEVRQKGLARRAGDLLDRLKDQVIAPLHQSRREVDRTVAALRAMESPRPGVDLNPLTQQLERRLQQRSVLYLMSPGRMLDRVRRTPGMLLRLPRTTWDVVFGGRGLGNGGRGSGGGNRQEDLHRSPAPDPRPPDFRAMLIDQFTIVQSRVDDVLRSTESGERWLTENSDSYQAARMDPAEAGRIADEELADLKDWLQKRWDAKPRDTLLLLRLLKHLPGGEKLTQWTEAAPYLLALVVAAHGAMFGGVDLMIIGGFSLATWLTEKLSNEVAARTKTANRKIAERFNRLTHNQIQRICAWLDQQAPPTRMLDELTRQADEMAMLGS